MKKPPLNGIMVNFKVCTFCKKGTRTLKQLKCLKRARKRPKTAEMGRNDRNDRKRSLTSENVPERPEGKKWSPKRKSEEKRQKWALNVRRGPKTSSNVRNVPNVPVRGRRARTAPTSCSTPDEGIRGDGADGARWSLVKPDGPTHGPLAHHATTSAL